MLLCGMLVAGCKEGRPGTTKPEERQQTLSLGLLPEQSIFKQVHHYEPLADYLSLRLKLQVKLVVLPSYEKAVSSFAEKKLDAAFLGSMTYILAHARLGLEVIARPVDLEGNSTYYGVMFVRKDSNIRSIRELKGKRLAFVDRNTTAGYLLPVAYFKKRGVDYRTYLKEYYFAGTHEDAIYDVLDRKADVGAAKSTILKRLAAEDARVRNDLFILSRTLPVPENSLSVRRDLDAQLKERIKKVLLHMHEEPEGVQVLEGLHAQKFIETKDSDFKSVYFFARELDIDLYSGREKDPQ